MTDLSRLRQQEGITITEEAEVSGCRVRLIRPQESKPPSDFTFIDLFAGIGGMRRGFESVGGKCVYTSEWNKYAQQTYLANTRVITK